MAISSIKCPECGGDKTISAGGNKYVCQYCSATFVNASETIAPASNTPSTVNCQYCGGEIVMGAQKCRHCGEWLNSPVSVVPPTPAQQPTYVQNGQQKYTSSKSKVVAALLSLFLGGLGIHEFYLGRYGSGVVILLITLCTAWMVVPAVIIEILCILQAIWYLCMSDQAFAEKYH